MTSQEALSYSNSNFTKRNITFLDYTIYDDEYWQSLSFKLTKSYTTFLGEEILEGSVVKISFKMQKPRFDYFIHRGCFYVQALNGVSIGGIYYSDLLII